MIFSPWTLSFASTTSAALTFPWRAPMHGRTLQAGVLTACVFGLALPQSAQCSPAGASMPTIREACVEAPEVHHTEETDRQTPPIENGAAAASASSRAAHPRWFVSTARR